MLFSRAQIGNVVVHDIIDSRLVTFVQQSATQLVQPDMKQHHSFRFPGPMPITVEREHVTAIRHGGFMFTPKADGLRVLLIFLRYYIENARQRLCVLLYRDGTCRLIQLSVNVQIYDNGGSVFDAELVQLNDMQTMRLEVFDCYAFRGVTVTSSQLQRRLLLIETLISQTNQSSREHFLLSAKPYFSLSKVNIENAEAFLHNTHQLDYATDGVVLVSVGPMRKCGTTSDQFKLKHRHTADLIVVLDEDDDLYYMASSDESDDTYVTKQQLYELPEGCTVNSIIECDMTISDGIVIFTPMQVRYDKSLPNTEHVIERTVQTIKDNITLGMLM
jgi:hypothetical protein